MHVPGWHEATKQLWERGKLQVVGIIQEQHPDRARLFMQWKRMDWPLLVDSLNLLEMKAVPVTLLIDEHGIVRMVKPERKDAEAFLSKAFEAPGSGGSKAAVAPNLSDANGLFLWGGPERLNQAIAAYQDELQDHPEDGATLFRLGVAYRKRHDSPSRQPNDFQNAVDSWKAALDIDPNQYIWRRRIQQYGPRLDKPYSFYDWVITARNEIGARGETPVPLVVEPGGAEFAQPANDEKVVAANGKLRTPKAAFSATETDSSQVETAVVPPTKATGATARVHVELRPNTRLEAHWNNEAGPLALWVDPPPGWQTNGNYFTVPNPPEPVSTETRRVEFELTPPGEGAPGVFPVPAYALYYVCEDRNGVCLYRRQDIEVEVKLSR